MHFDGRHGRPNYGTSRVTRMRGLLLLAVPPLKVAFFDTPAAVPTAASSEIRNCRLL